jgi:hypothetical protein
MKELEEILGTAKQTEEFKEEIKRLWKDNRQFI